LRLALCALTASLAASATQAQDTRRPEYPTQAVGEATSTQPAAGPEVDASLPLQWTSGRYRLSPSDVIEVKFPYVPEFDQTVTLQPDGYVSLRTIGDVRVQGRTLPEAQALISEKYAEILKNPTVNIVLKEFEKPYFMVAGQVERPGKYELRGATTLTQALVLAGGHTWSAKHSQVVLFRRFMAEWLEVKQFDVKKMYAKRDLSEDPLLRPGDTILVPKSLLGKIGPLIPRPGLGFYLNPLQ
jgi:polysaccharide export outer membrane protein